MVMSSSGLRRLATTHTLVKQMVERHSIDNRIGNPAGILFTGILFTGILFTGILSTGILSAGNMSPPCRGNLLLHS